MSRPVPSKAELAGPYEPIVYKTAEFLLEEHPKLNTAKNRDSLARDLQEAAENWFEDHNGA